MSDPKGKSEAEVFPRKGEWVVLVWDGDGEEWVFAGRARTERTLGGTVGRLRREGWKVRVLDEDGNVIHEDGVWD